MKIEEILRAMVENSELGLYPGGFILVRHDGYSTHIPNPKFYELFRDGYITFQSVQGHFEVGVIKLSLTPKGRELGESEVRVDLICEKCDEVDKKPHKDGDRHSPDCSGLVFNRCPHAHGLIYVCKLCQEKGEL